MNPTIKDIESLIQDWMMEKDGYKQLAQQHYSSSQYLQPSSNTNNPSIYQGPPPYRPSDRDYDFMRRLLQMVEVYGRYQRDDGYAIGYDDGLDSAEE